MATYPPKPLSLAELEGVPGVLGEIARERFGAYKDVETDELDVSTVSARASFLKALRQEGLAVIAEVKRSSPSQGAIADLDPAAAARAYEAGGAAALSILTEPKHFGGELAHLEQVAGAVDLPLLRKDFTLHPAQVLEAKRVGASAVLLIVAVLGGHTRAYLEYAHALELDALVEVHDERELHTALDADAQIIGVNNRDLRTLKIDLQNAPTLITQAREQDFEGVLVAESGYRQPQELKALHGLADAVLIGTSVAGSGDLTGALQRLRGEGVSDLQGKTAVVTGGSSGIGLALALRLADSGAKVHLVARGETRLSQAVQNISERGGSATSHSLDLTDDSQVMQFCDGLEHADILVHSAGYVDLGSVAEQEITTLDKHYQINLRAPYLLTQKVLPQLLDAQGQVVFVNSGAGLNAKGGWSQYAASKHGLKALADSLREEVRSKGVRVLSVYPGRTASPMQQKVRELENKSYDPDDFVQPDDVAQQVVSALLLPRTASVTGLVIRPG